MMALRSVSLPYHTVGRDTLKSLDTLEKQAWRRCWSREIFFFFFFLRLDLLIYLFFTYQMISCCIMLHYPIIGISVTYSVSNYWSLNNLNVFLVSLKEWIFDMKTFSLPSARPRSFPGTCAIAIISDLTPALDLS